MTEATTLPPRASKSLRDDLINEGKTKKEHNWEAWAAAGGFVVGAAATGGLVYVAVLSFTAGGGWIVLGIFAVGWSLAALGVTSDQLIKLAKAL